MIDVDMFAYSHLGLRFLWMSSSACAKCRRGSAAEGDSWCLGCLALENCATSLKGNWWSSSHRRLGEEIVVQAAKQLRAVKSLDTSLQSFADSCEARLRKASAPAAGARRPPEPLPEVYHIARCASDTFCSLFSSPCLSRCILA